MLGLDAMKAFVSFTESTQKPVHVCVVVVVFQCFKARNYIIIILLQEKY